MRCDARQDEGQGGPLRCSTVYISGISVYSETQTLVEFEKRSTGPITPDLHAGDVISLGANVTCGAGCSPEDLAYLKGWMPFASNGSDGNVPPRPLAPPGYYLEGRAVRPTEDSLNNTEIYHQ